LSLNFCILASGSSGNCSVIWNEKTAILIDCGCSSKYIVENLNKLGLCAKNLTAAFITHAHTDHISVLGLSFLRNNNIPVYLHEDSYEDIYRKYGSKIEECVNIPFYKSVEIGNILVESFDVYHKATNVSRNFGFVFYCVINARKYKIGYLTDTGKICSAIIKKLINSNILVIESNYNRMMLDLSFSPYDNKKWTTSGWGHLSNEDAANAICAIKQLSTSKDSLKYVFLAHISQRHNTQDIAMKTAKEILLSKGINDIKLFAAKRKQKSQAIRIS
jgi:phosphoribosyl 1,2-cyclic phosphodiesterase